MKNNIFSPRWSREEVLEDLRNACDIRDLNAAYGGIKHSAQVADSMEKIHMEDFSHNPNIWKQNLKTLLSRTGTTQEELARKLHRSHASISVLINTNSNNPMTPFLLEALCLVFGCLPEEFLDKSGCMTPIIYKREGMGVFCQNIIMSKLYDPKSIPKARALHMISLLCRLSSHTWENYMAAFMHKPSLAVLQNIDLLSDPDIDNTQWLDAQVSMPEYSNGPHYAATYAYHEAFCETQNLACENSPRLIILAQIACADQMLWYRAYRLLSEHLNSTNSLKPSSAYIEKKDNPQLTAEVPECFKIKTRPRH